LLIVEIFGPMKTIVNENVVASRAASPLNAKKHLEVKTKSSQKFMKAIKSTAFGTTDERRRQGGLNGKERQKKRLC